METLADKIEVHYYDSGVQYMILLGMGDREEQKSRENVMVICSLRF